MSLYYVRFNQTYHTIQEQVGVFSTVYLQKC